MGRKLKHLLLGHWLHDVVNVDRIPTCVRPKTVVDVISFDSWLVTCDARQKSGPSSTVSSCERSATEVTCRSGLTTRVTSDEPDEQPDGEMFIADIAEVVITGLNAEATKLVVESWTPERGLQRVERD